MLTAGAVPIVASHCGVRDWFPLVPENNTVRFLPSAAVEIGIWVCFLRGWEVVGDVGGVEERDVALTAFVGPGVAFGGHVGELE